MFEIELYLGGSLDHDGVKKFLRKFFRYSHVLAPMASKMPALQEKEVSQYLYMCK